MEDYFVTVDDEMLQDRLWQAIRGRGVFRRFKDMLAEYPDELQRWYSYKDAASGKNCASGWKWKASNQLTPKRTHDCPARRIVTAIGLPGSTAR